MEILSVDKLTKIYNPYKGVKETHAIDSISFSVDKGEFIGIMGPSGSGKTTLLNILCGIDRSTSGEVLIDNNNISTMKKDELALFRRKNIGYIFQDFNLLDSITVKENIALPLILDKVDAKSTEAKVNEIINLLDITEISSKYPYHISGGQKQKVASARALINNPAIIFADEPTGNLDSKSSNNIMNTMYKMNVEKNSTILMVTHDPFAASFCKRVIFIKDGKIKMEIYSDGDRQNFFDKILEVQSVIGR